MNQKYSQRVWDINVSWVFELVVWKAVQELSCFQTEFWMTEKHMKHAGNVLAPSFCFFIIVEDTKNLHNVLALLMTISKQLCHHRQRECSVLRTTRQVSLLPCLLFVSRMYKSTGFGTFKTFAMRNSLLIIFFPQVQIITYSKFPYVF